MKQMKHLEKGIWLSLDRVACAPSMLRGVDFSAQGNTEYPITSASFSRDKTL